MELGIRDQQTICAVSTPAGFGGISVIRVSGSDAYRLVRAMGKSLPNCPESHRIYFSTIRDENGSLIDEVLVSFFGHGRSFTGEEVVEISSHGNPLICESILSCLVAKGARLADRGEFTYRAFMNGRMDLIQAESVLSLIESQSLSSRALALRQLKGRLSESIELIEDSLVWCLAHIEANIDFSTEGLETVSGNEIFSKIGEIEKKLAELVGTFRSGKIIQDGFRVALIGPPNVGKSSILNFVCEEDRAIVTPRPGTTRDLVLGEIIHLGQKLVFVDTAGLRDEPGDEVEILGIARSRAEMGEADLVVYVFDLSVGLSSLDLSEIRGLDPKKVLILGNKSDLLEGQFYRAEDLFEEMKRSEWDSRPSFLSMSVFNSGDRVRLLTGICEFAKKSQPEVGAVISHVRHLEGLSMALKAARLARSEHLDGVGPEFIALSLKECLLCVQQVLGKVYDDQVLDRVFKEFCLGK